MIIFGVTETFSWYDLGIGGVCFFFVLSLLKVVNVLIAKKTYGQEIIDFQLSLGSVLSKIDSLNVSLCGNKS